MKPTATASTVRIPRAVRSSLSWTEERVALIDPSGVNLPGIYGIRGVRGQKPDGTYIGCDFIWFAPHCGFPMHTHDGDHILYIISGRGFIHVDGTDVEVCAGHVVHIPAEYPHRVFTQDCFLHIAATGHPHKEIASPDRMQLA
jgi:mannose-6-phosphate isomerase-like protein (cupin superfamily)